jgi:hypothetical protein
LNPILTQIIYGLLCILLAYINHRIILKDIRILHGLNGIFHVVFFLYFYFFVNHYLGITLLVIGRLVFDTSLNLFRKRGIGYVAENPKSIIDKIEKIVFTTIQAIYLLFKNRKQSLLEGYEINSIGKYSPSKSYTFIVGILPKIIYLITIIVLNIFCIH